MGADVLFICHTQYQAMVSVVKVLCAPEGFRADFWLSAALPARAQLAARLQEAGLAGQNDLTAASNHIADGPAANDGGADAEAAHLQEAATTQDESRRAFCI